MPEKPVSRLKEVLGKPVIVRITRRIRRSDKLEGFVVGLGRRWVLVHADTQDLHLDGYESLRLRDIKSAKIIHERDSFYARAVLDFAAQSPRAPRGIDLDSFHGLVTSIARRFPVLMVQPEEDDPEIGFIGSVHSVTSGGVTLRQITPEAQWHSELTSWRSSEITRVSFGTRYEEALVALGGPPPRAKLHFAVRQGRAKQIVNE